MHREALLNIVRVRYSEPPFFVGNDHATHRSKINNSLLSFFKAMITKDKANQGYFESIPEVSYAPINGEDFLNKIMAPVNLELIKNLVSHGWGVERTFRLFVKKLGKTSNIKSHSDLIPRKPPEYQDFLKLANLLQNAYMQQQLEIKVLSVSDVSEEGEVEHSNSRSKTKVMQLSLPPNTEETDRLAEFLNINKKRRTRYQFDLSHQESSGIFTRSILEVMQFLSLGVQIPPDDISSEALVLTRNEEGDLFDWNEVIGNLMTIHWSKKRPKKAFVSVHFRGYWFYIDGNDVSSKQTFSLFQHAYMGV